MVSDFRDVTEECELLLSDDSFKRPSSREGHAWTLLKFVICANLILLAISAFVLVLGVFMQDQNQDQIFLSSGYGLNRYFHQGIQLVTGYGMETKHADWGCLCDAIHSQLASFHLKYSEMAFIHPNVHGIASYLAALVNIYDVSTNSVKKLQIFDGSVTSENGEIPRPLKSGMHVSQMSSAVSKMEKHSRNLQKAKIASFLKIVKDLSHEGLLQSHHRILCLDSSAGREMRALKKKGFKSVEHIFVSLNPKASNQGISNSSNQGIRNSWVEDYTDQSFDFVFTTVFDRTVEPDLFVADIERILKVGGFAVMHVSLNAWHNKFIRSTSDNGAKPVTLLFTMSKVVYVSAAYAPGLDTVIVFKKEKYIEKVGHLEKLKEADQAQPNGDHATALSEKGTHVSGSLMKYGCRKCIKHPDVEFTPNIIE